MNTVKRSTRRTLQNLYGTAFCLKWQHGSSVESRTIKVFCFSGAVRQLTKQSTCPVADKNRARYETTNRSVQALIERPEQADQKVTRHRWFPDESIPQGHLDCDRQKRYTIGDCDYGHPA